MCPIRTSRFHFCITDHSPEIVPPPTMFLQVSAPKLIAGSSTFEKSVSSISNRVTDRRFASQTWVQILHVPRRPCFPCRCRAGSNQSPLKTVTHLSWWREARCPKQGDVLAQRNSDVGGRWREVQMSGQMKNVLFLFETFLPWEYLLVKCGCHSLRNSSYHRAPNCVLLYTTQQVYVICLYKTVS